MTWWRVEGTSNALRLSPVVRRDAGSEEFTWADLLHQQLGPVQVYVLYFPSRFDLPVDTVVHDALATFGQRTGKRTSVNFWDPKDPEMTTALAFFKLVSPPALVLATGDLRHVTKRPPTDRPPLFDITITDLEVLENRERLASAVNTVHEILVRGDRAEITRYVRAHEISKLLDAIAGITGDLRDEVVKLKPKIGLPGGVSLQLGG